MISEDSPPIQAGERRRNPWRRKSVSDLERRETIVDEERKTDIYTIGHSTRPIGEFIDILKGYGIERLIDVRSVPRSGHNPQFNERPLRVSMQAAGFDYIHMVGLGGFRKPVEGSTNGGWRNSAFRGYADYMQTPEFEENLDRLLDLAREKTTAIMCAEAVPWRCHRSLISDALIARGVMVTDIFDATTARVHEMSSFAVVEMSGRLSYPVPDNGQPRLL